MLYCKYLIFKFVFYPHLLPLPLELLIFFVWRNYWHVAFFIYISLSEHELHDNGIFCDKSIKEVYSYLNVTRTDDIWISQTSEQCSPLLKTQRDLAIDDSLESKNTQEIKGTVKDHDQTEDVEQPNILSGRFHILLKVILFY